MMKHIQFFILAFLLVALALDANAQQQGITFHKGNWASLLAEAKKTGKPFFVDFYAEWCGPCKWMVKNTFSNAKVGTFTTEHFVAYQIDAESGEGPALAQKYKIEAYPTLVFFDKDGNVLGRSVGALGADDFLPVLDDYYQKHNKKFQGTGGDGMKRATPDERAKLGPLFQKNN